MRLRLNWFSPLPPARTGIAEYTAFLLPALCARFDLVLWTDQDEWDKSLEKFAAVRKYDVAAPPWSELNRGDVNVYHIGNHPAYHGSIWEISRVLPGIVEIHDIHLQHFFAGIFRESRSDRDSYLSAMARYHGREGRRDAELFWDGMLSTEEIAQRWPLTELALEGALGVIVHNADAVEVLRGRKRTHNKAVRAFERKVVYLPLPRATAPCPPRRVSYAMRKVSPYRIVIFGHIGRNRRVDLFIRAWGSMPQRNRFVLDICGELSDGGAVQEAIREHRMEALIKVHGYQAEKVLCGFLERAHLAVNLRYPTMGEASGSQLFIWEYSLPTIVTRVGWYATIPEDAAAFVDPRTEIADIQKHLQSFLTDPERFALLGQRGCALLNTRHNADQYAQGVVELAGQVRGMGIRIASAELATRAGAAMADWTPAVSSDREFERVAGAIRGMFETDAG
jgi:glycosyltransferase involved in cell wall biosynthesis